MPDIHKLAIFLYCKKHAVQARKAIWVLRPHLVAISLPSRRFRSSDQLFGCRIPLPWTSVTISLILCRRFCVRVLSERLSAHARSHSHSLCVWLLEFIALLRY